MSSPTPQPYAQYTGHEMGPRTNTLAIVALVLGFTVPIGAIVCGHIALNQIKVSGEAGHGLALAGTILGYAFTFMAIVLSIAYVLFFVFIFAVAVPTGTLH
ncbi:hypothetical protein BH09ACT4_BH09ACT4_14440 [soil metagenome]